MSGENDKLKAVQLAKMLEGFRLQGGIWANLPARNIVVHDENKIPGWNANLPRQKAGRAYQSGTTYNVVTIRTWPTSNAAAGWCWIFGYSEHLTPQNSWAIPAHDQEVYEKSVILLPNQHLYALRFGGLAGATGVQISVIEHDINWVTKDPQFKDLLDTTIRRG